MIPYTEFAIFRYLSSLLSEKLQVFLHGFAWISVLHGGKSMCLHGFALHCSCLHAEHEESLVRNTEFCDAHGCL